MPWPHHLVFGHAGEVDCSHAGTGTSHRMVIGGFLGAVRRIRLGGLRAAPQDDGVLASSTSVREEREPYGALPARLGRTAGFGQW